MVAGLHGEVSLLASNLPWDEVFACTAANALMGGFRRERDSRIGGGPLAAVGGAGDAGLGREVPGLTFARSKASAGSGNRQGRPA